MQRRKKKLQATEKIKNKQDEQMKSIKKKAARVISGGKMTPKEKEAFYEELDKVMTQKLPITQEFEDKIDAV